MRELKQKSKWTNLHRNLRTIEPDTYRVFNDDKSDGTLHPMVTGMGSYWEVLKTAERNNRRIRPFGGVWSLSEAAVPNHYALNTNGTPYIAAVGEDSIFAQCGVAVGQIHDWLWRRGRALPTSGASDGQTIAGAISTGTHGAAFHVGAMQDSVLAIHILTPSRRLWLEDPAHPVVTPAMRAVLPGDPISDRATFEAALVSFGSFGLIHGYVLRTVPAFKLEYRMDTAPRPLSSLWPALGTGDPDKIFAAVHPHAGDPFHLEIVINGQSNEAYVKTMVRLPHTAPTSIHTSSGRLSADAMNFVAALNIGMSQPVSFLADLGIRNDIPTPNPAVGSPHEIFGPTGQAPSATKRIGLSTEIGIPTTRILHFIELALKVAKDHPFLGAYALRFVKASRATLGWTLFHPVTCTIETPMIRNAHADAALDALWKGLVAKDIPHTFHWGQCMPKNRAQVLAQYEGQRLNAWRAAREVILPTSKERWMFSNPMTDALGL